MDAVLRNFRNIPCPRGDKCTQPGCQWYHHSQSSETKTAGAAAVGGRDGTDDSDTTSDKKPANNLRNSASSEPVPFITSEAVTSPLKRKAQSPPASEQLSPKRAATGSAATGSANSSSTITGSANSSSTITGSATTRSAATSITTATMGPNTSKQNYEARPAPITPRKLDKASCSSPADSDSDVPSLVRAGKKTTVFKPTPVAGTTPAVAVMPAATLAATPEATPERKAESLNPRHLKIAPASHEFRYRVLKMLHEQYARLNGEVAKTGPEKQKLLLSDQELIWMALDEEQRLATDKPSIYSNLIKNRIMQYKRMDVAKWKEERLAQRAKESATSPAQSKPGFLGEPKTINTGLTPLQEVSFLRQHLISPTTELAKFGYVVTPPSDEEIRKAREGEEASQGWEVCDRCTKRFQVFPGRRAEDGALASGGRCTYHYGKIFYQERSAVSSAADNPRRLRCCKEAVGDSPGCVSCETHVFKAPDAKRLAAVVPFVETPPNPSVSRDLAVAFDCEMGYTVRGMELIRLTATSWPDGKELLDVLVRPVGELLDLNTRYSGVTRADFAEAEPWTADCKPGQQGEVAAGQKKTLRIVSSPIVARDLLFSLVAPETPLIGHGLENDLNAVRMVHPTLVDTVILYPHKRGLPMRNGLKRLMEIHLNRAIQVEDEGSGLVPVGHDSAEDARAAGDLVRYKIQTEWARMKNLKGWAIGTKGDFVPPTERKVRGRLSEKFLEGEGGQAKTEGLTNA